MDGHPHTLATLMLIHTWYYCSGGVGCGLMLLLLLYIPIPVSSWEGVEQGKCVAPSDHEPNLFLHHMRNCNFPACAKDFLENISYGGGEG